MIQPYLIYTALMIITAAIIVGVGGHGLSSPSRPLSDGSSFFSRGQVKILWGGV